MVQLHEKYVTDSHGRKMAVVLDIRVYQKLQECLENLQDALDIKKAKNTAGRFVSLDEMQKRLRS